MTLEEARRRAGGGAVATTESVRDLLKAHCYNHFDAVVEALERCVRRMEDEYPENQWNEELGEGINDARRILNDAKEVKA